MRLGENRKRSSGENRSAGISNSRAMGVILLIALLFVFQVAAFVLHKVEENRGVENVAGEVAGKTAGVARFRFDPNTITPDSLQMLGFTPAQAKSVLNYRSKGGTFRKKEDFAKLYVVDSAMYNSLAEFIVIGDARKKEAQGKRGNAGKSGYAKAEPHGKTAKYAVGKPENVAGDTNSIYGKKVVRNRYMCNLNTADSVALVRLYGIGGYYAKKILRYRSRLGGSFVDVRQLMEIEGFTQERFDRIKENIFVSKEDIKGFSLLGAGEEALGKHPYIGPYAARGIISYVTLKGKGAFRDDLHLLDMLVKEHVIAHDNAARLREYLLHL